MGSKIAGTGHSAAVLRAQQVSDHRAEQHREHEKTVTAALVEFFEAKARADKVRADGQSRATRLIQAAEDKAARLTEQARAAGQQITEQAEKDAADHDAQIGQAIRRLRGLGETTAAVASMTNLSQAVVRAIEREHLDPGHPAPRKQPAPSAAKPRGQADAVPE